MKFLVDNAISPFVATALSNSGYDAVHVRHYKMEASDDQSIFERAALENRTIISADTDFGFLLAKREVTKPSVILFRKGSERNPAKQVELLKANLSEEVIAELELGCILIFEKSRMRIRRLPLMDKKK